MYFTFLSLFLKVFSEKSNMIAKNDIFCEMVCKRIILSSCVFLVFWLNGVQTHFFAKIEKWVPTKWGANAFFRENNFSFSRFFPKWGPIAPFWKKKFFGIGENVSRGLGISAPQKPPKVSFFRVKFPLLRPIKIILQNFKVSSGPEILPKLIFSQNGINGSPIFRIWENLTLESHFFLTFLFSWGHEH